MDKLKDHIKKLREDFTRSTLSESEVCKDPFNQFATWLQQAVEAEVTELQAMNLATVSEDFKPTSRIVYLREFENNSFIFYTNYNSKKAKDLKTNPNAALTFFWPQLERQIRIEGIVEKLEPVYSDTYFNARPYESKIGAWASKQSQALNSREDLEKKTVDYKMKFSPETVTRPEFWGGYRLKANYYEFWQGRENRLHDRISYRIEKGIWVISRLAP